VLVVALISTFYQLRAIKRGKLETISGPVTLRTVIKSGISYELLQIEDCEFEIDYATYSAIYEKRNYRVYFVRTVKQDRTPGYLIAIECDMPQADTLRAKNTKPHQGTLGFAR
jgi:hypothetical protein